MPHVLYRSQNYRNIRLDESTVGKAEVGVFRKDGSIKYVRWEGFIDRRDAKSHYASIPVLLKVKRVDGEDLPENTFVQGCWINHGVYAVIDSDVAQVTRVTSTHANITNDTQKS